MLSQVLLCQKEAVILPKGGLAEDRPEISSVRKAGRMAPAPVATNCFSAVKGLAKSQKVKYNSK